MAFDAAVVLALFAFAWLGAHRGAGETAIRLLGLCLAYGLSWLAGRFGGDAAAAALGVPSWLGAAAVGVVVLVILQGGVELAARRVRPAAGESVPDGSRVLGAALGIARGALLVLPVVWLAGFVESARGSSPAAASLPDFSGARSASLGQALAGAAADRLAASGDGGTRVAARLLGHPSESFAALGAIASDTRMRVLQSDPGFWSDLSHGRVDAALARPSFTELARDAELRGKLADLGLVAPSSALDAQQFQSEMAAVMTEVAPRLERIQADPGFQELMADEGVRARVQAGDTLALLADPRVQQLVARLAE